MVWFGVVWCGVVIVWYVWYAIEMYVWYANAMALYGMVMRANGAVICWNGVVRDIIGIGMVWYGVAWPGVAWYGMVWSGLVWYSLAGLVLYGNVMG